MQFEGNFIRNPKRMNWVSNFSLIVGTVILPGWIIMYTNLTQDFWQQHHHWMQVVSLLLIFSAFVLPLFYLWFLRKSKIRIDGTRVEITDATGRTLAQTYRTEDLDRARVAEEYFMKGQDRTIGWKCLFGFLNWSKIELVQDGKTHPIEFSIPSDFQRYQLEKIVREWRQRNIVPVELTK